MRRLQTILLFLAVAAFGAGGAQDGHSQPVAVDDSTTGVEAPDVDTTGYGRPNAGPLSLDDYTVVWIESRVAVSVIDAPASVLAVLGRPASIVEEAQNGLSTYLYGGVSFVFDQDLTTTRLIVIDDPSVETSRGVRVGKPLEEVFLRYGEPTTACPAIGLFIYRYSDGEVAGREDHGVRLYFYSSNDQTVARIALGGR